MVNLLGDIPRGGGGGGAIFQRNVKASGVLCDIVNCKQYNYDNSCF